MSSKRTSSGRSSESIKPCRIQWRIQDFPKKGANSQSGCANLLFCKFFAENCMKMKEIGPQGGGGARVHAPSLDPSVLSVVDLHTN